MCLCVDRWGGIYCNESRKKTLTYSYMFSLKTMFISNIFVAVFVTIGNNIDNPSKIQNFLNVVNATQMKIFCVIYNL